MEPEKIGEDFPIIQKNPELSYLDSAATTQKPETVIQRVEKFYEEENSNVGRGLYNLASRATQEYGDARRTVADFIGASSDELVFVRNTSEAANLVASSLELDGKIVVPEMAHHSEQLPWRRKAEEEGLEMEYIPTKDHELDMEEAREVIDEDTALVSVSHISNVFGCENPVEVLVELAHENDAYIFVDGAQSVPRMPVDVKELDIDFLAFSGHKMLGPTGIGALYGRKEIFEDMEPYQVGGGMIRTVRKDETGWAEAPEKFEAGTPNIAGAVGLAEAVKYLEEVGMENVYEHDKKISGKIAEKLSGIEGVELYTPESDYCLVSFSMEQAHPHDIAEVLNQNDVAVRAGQHCAQPQMEKMNVSGTVRASPYIYNTEEDVEKLVEAVKEVKEVF